MPDFDRTMAIRKAVIELHHQHFDYIQKDEPGTRVLERQEQADQDAIDILVALGYEPTDTDRYNQTIDDEVQSLLEILCDRLPDLHDRIC